METREDQVVAETGAECRGVDCPLARQLTGVRERVPGRSTTFSFTARQQEAKHAMRSGHTEGSGDLYL